MVCTFSSSLGLDIQSDLSFILPAKLPTFLSARLGICNLYHTHPLVLTALTHPMKNYLSNAGFSHYISWNVRFLHRLTLIPTFHPTYLHAHAKVSIFLVSYI